MAARAKSRTRRPARSRKKSSKSLMPWFLTGAIALAGIFFYENPEDGRSVLQVAKLDGLITTGTTPQKTTSQKQVARKTIETKPKTSGMAASNHTQEPSKKTQTRTALLDIPRPGPRPAVDVGAEKDLMETAAIHPAGTADRWYLCASRTDHCVIDGATFMLEGRKIRLAGIEVPKMADAACEAERKRGAAAMERLRALLNEGRLTLTSAAGTDANGALLYTASSNGRSIERRLIAEGLARGPGSAGLWCAKDTARN